MRALSKIKPIRMVAFDRMRFPLITGKNRNYSSKLRNHVTMFVKLLLLLHLHPPQDHIYHSQNQSAIRYFSERLKGEFSSG